MSDQPSDTRTGSTPASTPDGKDLAARIGAALWDLEVVESFAVTPGMRRVRLTAPGLDALAPEPGQDLMLAVPSSDLRYRRRYTIRHFRPEALTVDLDVVVHGDGPGARWATTAQPGDHIEAIGPRGKITVVDDAAWHLFAGDDSGAPAALAMTEALGSGARALLIHEVPDRDHELPLHLSAGANVQIQWLHRGGAEPGRPDLLAAAIEAVALPSGRGHAYLTGELNVVAAMRQALLSRGLGADQISPKSYWRRGVANAPHGEPPKD